ADRNRSHWSTSKTPSYTKSVSWQHHLTCDVKWKIVNGRKDSLEQSQADLYQMLAYGLNYQEGEGDMILIYPYHNGFNQPSPHPYEFSHQKENRLRLWVVPFFIGESLQTSELRFPSGAEFI
ncbi:hypothetical protein QP203_19030, partial [Escherichia coli]|nr:hypothetical protein [Escherichia coli]